MNKISVCIPCYEMRGKGIAFLSEAINSVLLQRHSDFEILISDNSLDCNIENFIQGIRDRRIKYYRNRSPIRNMSTNVNNSIKMASHDIVKILFQDDFFYSTECLRKLNEAMSDRKAIWGSVGFNHTNEDSSLFYDPRVPAYHPNTLIGNNQIGAPSNIFFRKSCGELFDESMIWLMDCEFYYRLKKHSNPVFIRDIMVTSRIWGGSETSKMAEETKKKELAYVSRKHPEFRVHRSLHPIRRLTGLSKLCIGKIKRLLELAQVMEVVS